jgi:hypothetical protein
VKFLSDTYENVDKHTFVGSPNFGMYVLIKVLDVWLHGSTVHKYNND